jgi:hypothetical protein
VGAALFHVDRQKTDEQTKRLKLLFRKLLREEHQGNNDLALHSKAVIIFITCFEET